MCALSLEARPTQLTLALVLTEHQDDSLASRLSPLLLHESVLRKHCTGTTRTFWQEATQVWYSVDIDMMLWSQEAAVRHETCLLLMATLWYRWRIFVNKECLFENLQEKLLVAHRVVHDSVLAAGANEIRNYQQEFWDGPHCLQHLQIAAGNKKEGQDTKIGEKEAYINLIMSYKEKAKGSYWSGT